MNERMKWMNELITVKVTYLTVVVRRQVYESSFCTSKEVYETSHNYSVEAYNPQQKDVVKAAASDCPSFSA